LEKKIDKILSWTMVSLLCFAAIISLYVFATIYDNRECYQEKVFIHEWINNSEGDTSTTIKYEYRDGVIEKKETNIKDVQDFGYHKNLIIDVTRENKTREMIYLSEKAGLKAVRLLRPANNTYYLNICPEGEYKKGFRINGVLKDDWFSRWLYKSNKRKLTKN